MQINFIDEINYFIRLKWESDPPLTSTRSMSSWSTNSRSCSRIPTRGCDTWRTGKQSRNFYWGRSAVTIKTLFSKYKRPFATRRHSWKITDMWPLWWKSWPTLKINFVWLSLRFMHFLSFRNARSTIRSMNAAFNGDVFRRKSFGLFWPAAYWGSVICRRTMSSIRRWGPIQFSFLLTE